MNMSPIGKKKRPKKMLIEGWKNEPIQMKQANTWILSSAHLSSGLANAHGR